MATGKDRKFQCTVEGCKALVSAEIPEATLINKPTFSMLLLVHEVAVVCPNCGQAYTFILRGLNLRAEDVAWAQVELKKEESDIVIPPAGLGDLLRKH